MENETGHFHISSLNFLVFLCYYILVRFLIRTTVIKWSNSSDLKNQMRAKVLAVFD